MSKFFLAVALLCATAEGFACDVCGCSIGAVSTDIMSMQNMHFVGLHYVTRSFTSTHPTLFANEIAEVSEESFQSLELRGRYTPFSFLQIDAVVPYHLFTQAADGAHSRYSGIGDFVVMPRLVLFAQVDSGSFDHRLSFGGGLKAPTGDNQIPSGESTIVIPSMQPGTGSWDALFSASYILRWKRWGLLSDIGFRHNGVNPQHYRFGNRYNARLDVFHSLVKRSEFILRPRIGVSIERAEQDNRNTRINSLNPYSGGTIVENSVGLNLLWKNWLADARVSVPVFQNLGSGYVKTGPQISIQLNYLIQTNEN